MKSVHKDDLKLKEKKINTTNIAILDAFSVAIRKAIIKNPRLSVVMKDISEICADTVILLELSQKGEQE